ncbi:MAG TPA: glycosyltransferase [Acidimicrobiia bacterium]|nr:glycosyltransferase [Acidimicrobiia bacterium]
MEEKQLARALVRLRPHSAPTEGPLVSIVVTNRDGEKHLRRLLEGLHRRTHYRTVEVVLVDNGSTDGSLDIFDQWTGKKQLIANEENRSFSAANNQGIRAAEGEFVLLANNDIEPVHPDWLGFMVQSLEEGVVAVGAMLVYPKRPRGVHSPAHPDLTIQHNGSSFEYSKWGVRAFNTGSGRDPLSIETPGRRLVPAVTAACLLARRVDLLVTPFDEQYWYGSEDWDLCLRLGDLGDIVVDERAILFHHEFGTQDEYMDEAWLERRVQNHQWFNGLWGPALMRKLRREVAGPAHRWFFRGDRPPTVSINSGSDATTRRLAEHLQRQANEAGWHVAQGESQSSDVVVALVPPRDVQRFAGRDLSVAVVSDLEQEWARSGSLDAAKRIVVPSRVGRARLDSVWGPGIAEIIEEVNGPHPGLFARLLEFAAPQPTAMRVGISTCAPDWERAQYWGDTHLARGLMRAFRRLGHEATELIASDWQGTGAASCDVVIHLRGLTRRPVARGQWNLLWIISHPDRLESGECDDYDLIASASQHHAEQLSSELGRPVHFLPQATDTDTFKIGPSNIDYEASVLYVGNARWPHRRAPRWMMRNRRPFHLYGKNWDRFPEAKFVRNEYVPNQDLAAAYRSAAVVVADHHGSMRTNGFVANRICDVFASGGVVLSDDVSGLPEMFGDLIPTYSNARELESQLRVLLADPSLRRRIAADGRQVVLSNHTLDHRARTWLELLDQL